ncbi:MAG: GSCFA domain-containing protein [Prevotella bivia]|uniref:GSCFA domain-containing protein n=1 Tax=Prevotella bivia DNF00320 TaxID=1401068 RepID=A0A096AC25_9BACT|nr:GSCFA domain-containing protein [Prevotella bivia]KGF44455.1 hypothetical protein HMPREF0647_06720 [Prevotella bivia DNF00320]MDU7315168.1 GSCFA domain-containing protein [Prevotella bivia]MDZ3818292.1 GSCFA domain-containing protein [Prevotella bivia]
MDFRTVVSVPRPPFQLDPLERILFVGSCFATHIGERFQAEKFRTKVNPFGVMYNPVSILHTVERIDDAFDTAVFTLGTNHVYRENATGEIVDNCEKRPQRLFTEEELTVEECFDALSEAYHKLVYHNKEVKVLITVSPIRYAKYGYHESQLSKAVLLLAADRLVKVFPEQVFYFPAYEIVNDELRDYRFYAPDMLHPSAQAVEYIWERLQQSCFSPALLQFLEAWRPIKEGLAHRPFNSSSLEYQQFLEKIKSKAKALQQQYPALEVES